MAFMARTHGRLDKPGNAGMKQSFKGNKGFLPSKPCAVRGRVMTWRRAWEKNWELVRYCSDACRARKAQARTHA